MSYFISFKTDISSLVFPDTFPDPFSPVPHKIAEIAGAAQLPLATDKSPEFSTTFPEQGTINALPYLQP